MSDKIFDSAGIFFYMEVKKSRPMFSLKSWLFNFLTSIQKKIQTLSKILSDMSPFCHLEGLDPGFYPYIYRILGLKVPLI